MIDRDTSTTLFKAGIDPAAFERFAIAESAALRAQHEERIAARGRRAPTLSTLADASHRKSPKSTIADFAVEFWVKRRVTP